MVVNAPADFQFRLAGNASLSANKPIDFGVERSWASIDTIGNPQLKREQHLILIAVIHQWPEWQTLGRGKLQRPGGNSNGKRPLNMRRLACVARILPVNVPAGLKLEVETRIGRLASIESLRNDEQFNVHVGSICGTRHCFCGQAHGQQQEHQKNQSESTHGRQAITPHPWTHECSGRFSRYTSRSSAASAATAVPRRLASR